MRKDSIQLTIAGLTLRLHGSPVRTSSWSFDAPYQQFISFPDSRHLADADTLILRWHHADLPDLTSAEVVFDSGASWSVVRWQGRPALLQHDRFTGGQPHQVTLFDPNWGHGDLYVRSDLVSQLGQRYSPLGYPLDEVLIIHLLAQGRGALFHACGVDDNGCGLVFVGVSGAGKSTTARLWQGLSGVTLLSDDRVIVRRRGTEFWAYGTPWSGEAGAASAKTVPLKHIFLLEHGPENRVQRLSPARAAARMMLCVFPTYWDRAGMAFTLDFLAALTATVPCHRLHFVPDESTVDFVRQLNH